MTKDFDQDVAIPSTDLDIGDSPYVVTYMKHFKQVEITGAGWPEDHPHSKLLVAVGFKNLTIRQAHAMELGLRILSYLETGVCPSFESTRLESQPGAELNMS